MNREYINQVSWLEGRCGPKRMCLPLLNMVSFQKIEITKELYQPKCITMIRNAYQVTISNIYRFLMSMV